MAVTINAKGTSVDQFQIGKDSNGLVKTGTTTFKTPKVVPTEEGSLYWDAADGNKTLSLVMAGGNAVQQVGQETYYRIKASSAITEGQVVMFTGTVGASGALTGAPASGLVPSTASYVMGIATENIALNGWGYVTGFGLVRNINTTGGAEAWVDGQILYYDPTVAGGLSKNVPVTPNAKIQVCSVVHAAANGSLFVRPSFGGELGQYEGDVNFSSLAANQLMVRNGTNTNWENSTGLVWDESNDRLGVGTSAPQNTLHLNKSATPVAGIDSTVNGLTLSAGLTGTSSEKVNRIALYAFGGGSNSIRLAHGGAATSESSPVYPTNLTGLGTIAFAGWDENTSSWQGGCSIAAIPEVTWNATTRDTCMRFFTTKGTTASEKARLTSNGNLLIATTTDDGINKLQVAGTAKATNVIATSLLKGNTFTLEGVGDYSGDVTESLLEVTLTEPSDYGGDTVLNSGVIFNNRSTYGTDEFTKVYRFKGYAGDVVLRDGVEFYDTDTNYIKVKAPSTLTTNYTLNLPAKNGTLATLDDVTGGSSNLTIQSKTANYTVISSDNGTIINCSTPMDTVTLTAAATLGAGFNCWIWNSYANDAPGITVDPAGTELIDGQTTYSIRRGQGIRIVCDGTGWQIVDTRITRTFATNIQQSLGQATASGNNALSIGTGAANGVQSIAIGIGATAGSTYSVAMGKNAAGQASTTATGAGAVALNGSYASGADSFAVSIGDNTSTYGASGLGSVAIGKYAKATGSHSVAIGHNVGLTESSVAASNSALAIMGNVAAASHYATAIGLNSSAQQAKVAVGLGAMALGGSYASGTDSFAAAIGTNSTSYGATGANSIAMGFQAKATGPYSISIGWGNTAGNRSIAIGGSGSTATDNSVVIGSWSSNISQAYSATLGGGYATDHGVQNRWSFGLVSAAGLGNAQRGMFVLLANTTDATQTTMKTNSSAASAANQVYLPDNSAVTFEGRVVAKQSGSTNTASWLIRGLLVRGSGAATTTVVTQVIDTINNPQSWGIEISADTTLGLMSVKFTGAAATTIRCVAAIDTVETILA